VTYWLDVFTGKTWEEFLAAGGQVSGFRHRRRRSVDAMRPGDRLLCYVTGVSRWIGVLEVTGASFRDDSGSIWEDGDFPVRIPVEVRAALEPEYGVPIHETLPLLSFYDPEQPNAWGVRFRQSPAKLSEADGRVVEEAIIRARQAPVVREYSEAKWGQGPRTYDSPAGEVTIPEDQQPDASESEPESGPTHSDVQRMLVEIGVGMGLDVWVATNDKGRISDTVSARLLDALPTQFDRATSKTIEHIDVLWFRGKSIEAAFEIEHTTAIYSGLLRMADLCAMQPNLNIRLFIVAPEERRRRVLEEIGRPAFSALPRPLHELCQYLSYGDLERAMSQYNEVLRHLQPAFLDEIAQSASAR